MVPKGTGTDHDEVTFPSTPYGPLDLPDLQQRSSKVIQTTQQLLPGPCNQEVVNRNGALLDSLRQSHSTEWLAGGETIQRLRLQRKQWAASTFPRDLQQQPQAPQGEHEQQWSKLNKDIPAAFRFQEQSSSMHLYWSESSLSEKSAIRRPTPSHLLSTPRPGDIEHQTSERPAKRHKLSSTSTAKHHLVLTISLYSRPLKRSTRQSRQKAAAEQRLADHHESRRVDEETSEDDSQMGAPQEPLFETHLGLPSADDHIDVLPRPTQVIELRSDHTLADLSRAFYCRLNDLPERHPDQGHKDEADIIAHRFTGRKRSDNGVVILIEDELFCQKDSPTAQEHLSSKHFTPNHTPLHAVPFTALTQLHLNKPYSYVHQGICQHIFTIDQVRLPATSQSHDAALTTYLSTQALQHPVSIFAKTKASDTYYPLATCTVCDKYTAKYVIVGGGRAVPALKEQVSPLCPSCLSMFAGIHPPKKVARKQNKSKRLGAKEGEHSVQDEAADAGNVEEDDAGDSTGGVAHSQADRTNDSVWQAVAKRLDSEEGWTIVPLLD